MSSSDTGTKDVGQFTGRVFLDASSGQKAQLTIDDFKNQETLGRWSKDVEREVLARVQAKAAAKAKDIVNKAIADAKEIRRKAREEGYAEGATQAQQQLEQAHREMAESLGQALAAVQEGSESIWRNHRNELISLLHLSVEKVLRIELDSQRQEILTGFMDQAAEALDDHAGLTITVNPEDAETMRQILVLAGQRFPRLSAWRVKVDPKMQSGGLLVESDHGMVDNTIEGRLSIIEPILKDLELPVAALDNIEE